MMMICGGWEVWKDGMTSDAFMRLDDDGRAEG